MFRSVLLLVAALWATTATAQRPPMKWGDIPDEHLQMLSFPADTNAAAVILGDFGETSFETSNNWTQVYRIHRRVKLLRESSYEDFGTVNISYPTGRNGARVSDLKAQTVVLGADGKKVVHKVDRGSIFKERLEHDWERLSFTFPALQPGAIVEFSYQLSRPMNPFLAPWGFQMHEPVLYSEYRVEFPGQLQYVVSAVGNAFERMTVNENDRATRPDGVYSRNRWVMENVPALREEPYMTTTDDYSMALRFQLAGIHIPGFGLDGFLNSWEKVAEDFMGRAGQYGMHLESPGRDVRDAATEAVGDATEPVEKMKRVYDYVRTRIDFNGRMGPYAERSPKDVLKSRTGSSPETAVLLVAMLREAGLTAHPVMLSTRSHGMPNTGYPILTQFNDLIAAVEIGSKRYLLDATDRLRPYDMLPFNSLNGQAWMVRHPNPVWIPVEAAHRGVEERTVTLTIGEDGHASGQVEATQAGYEALFTRKELEESTDETAFVRSEVFDDMGGLSLSNVAITNPEDVTEPVVLRADFTLDGFAQAAGDYLYLSPVLLDRLTENPLRAPERLFPVDMGYGIDRTYTATFTIPEGYEVREVPSGKQVGVQGGGALFKSAIEVEGRTVRVTNRFTVAKTIFPPQQYAALRGFYDRVVAASAEQIVLQRAATTEAVTESGE